MTKPICLILMLMLCCLTSAHAAARPVRSNAERICPAVGTFAEGAALARQAGQAPSQVFALIATVAGPQDHVIVKYSRSIVLQVYAAQWTPAQARQMIETQCFLSMR